jgi:hypothetical protein
MSRVNKALSATKLKIENWKPWMLLHMTKDAQASEATMMLIQKMFENETFSQIHQYFTSSLFANFFSQKIPKKIINREKLHLKYFCTKNCY